MDLSSMKACTQGLQNAMRWRGVYGIVAPHSSLATLWIVRVGAWDVGRSALLSTGRRCQCHALTPFKDIIQRRQKGWRGVDLTSR